ncbi:MAG: phosphoribosylaminoimidazolesuccinocarboxamide synthase [Deltaproteobacteria bacterium]|nr:MAG: phosphoribosylaminoimidazolesuccinocarboxamide synthase [Deltaproteobacteria bacterium]
MIPARGAALYKGKAKSVFATDDPSLVILRFSDEATAFNGVKQAVFQDKGRINCAITAHLFDELAARGVPSHMVRQLGERDLLCHKVEIIPVEVVVRNVIAGSLARRYGLTEGEPLDEPLVELFLKSDELNDPLLTEEVAVRFDFAKRWELQCMREQALQVNDLLRAFWGELGIDLIDFKLEFGRLDGKVVLADEITPDGSRLWERGTGQRFDKDVFRRDLGDLSQTYRALHARVFGETQA